MPIRGHSGVQGGAEMGCLRDGRSRAACPIDAGVGRGARRRSTASRSAPERGRSAAEMVEAAGRGELDVLWSSGGNFLDTLPDPARRARRRWRGCRCASTWTSSSAPRCWSTGEEVLLLPGDDALRAARRRHRDDHRATGRVQPGDPRPAHRRGAGGVADLPRPGGGGRSRAAPERLGCDDAQAIREEIARVVPFYDGIQHLAEDRRRVPVGRRAAVRRLGLPDRATARRTSGSSRPARPSCPMAASCCHPPRQAVQLDGLEAA